MKLIGTAWTPEILVIEWLSEWQSAILVSSGVPCPPTRDNEELPMSMCVLISLISKKNGLKSRRKWIWWTLAWKEGFYGEAELILRVKPPNTRRFGREYGLGQWSSGPWNCPQNQIEIKIKICKRWRNWGKDWPPDTFPMKMALCFCCEA